MARHCFDERARIAPPGLIIDKLGSYWMERYLWAIEQQKLTNEALTVKGGAMATGRAETVDELLCDILGAPSETDRESKMERRRREVAQSWAELAGEGQVHLGFPGGGTHILWPAVGHSHERGD